MWNCVFAVQKNFLCFILMWVFDFDFSLLIFSRSARASGSVFCLWDLRWSGLLALPVWSTLDTGEGREGTGFRPERWAESISRTTQGVYGGPIWEWHLRHVILPSPHTILQGSRPLQSLHPESGDDGRCWAEERSSQWRHLAISRLQSLRHSQD